MSKPINISRAALRQIARSDDVELALFVIADKIKDACDPSGHLGEGAYVAVSGKGKTRSRASVIAVTAHARNSNALHNTLVHALDAGRG